MSKLEGNIYHNIITNILLPKNTIIKLIDYSDNKIYTYEITTDEDIYNYNNSCPSEIDCQKRAKYPFSLFTERGKSFKILMSKKIIIKIINIQKIIQLF